MADCIERRFGRLTVRIDRHLCVGFGDCIDVAADLFELDDEGVARFVGDAPAAEPDEERLRAACGSCPVDALSLLDEAGRQLVP